MTSQDLLHRLSGAPFKPFRMRMAYEVNYDVSDPRMVIVGATSAVVATRDIRDADGRPITTDWRTISIEDIVELSDLDSARKLRRK